MYFTTANDSGNYNISYIKDGIYKILSFDDENGNYILDPESEAHAFLSDSINLKTEQTIKPLQALLQNIKPITLINARPAGQYAEIKFSREPFAYKLQPPYLYHNITGENKDIIRVYKPTSINYKDSIQAFLSTNDSLGNQILDTLKLVFLESKRKPATFSYSVQPTRITEGIDSTITLLFNKPIIQLDTTKFHFFSDSIFNYIPKADYVWNHNKTELAYTLLQKIDSIKQKFLQSIPADTTSIDSSLIAENPLAALQPTPNHTLEFEIEKGAFITVEQDTSDAKTLAIVEAPKPPTGLLRLQVETTQASYTIQLLKDNGTVAYQTNEINQNITFRNLSAATYTIRVLIDNNSDGKWSYGNLLKNQEPEQVYINPETVTIRENWELEMMITF
ncbi:MAG: hypothetical protein HRT61_09090 [Ekhidna sp.]|nr:hypothetical protein [Ekhidna sp.]